MNIFRSLPAKQKSVLTVIFFFNIELVNIIIAIISSLFMLIEASSKFHFLIGQAVGCLLYGLGCVVCQLFLAISLSKILFVTHFTWMFSRNQSKFGYIIIGIAMVVAVLPCGIVSMYNTVQGQLSGNFVAIITGLPYQTKKLSFQEAYFVLWALLAACMLVLALNFIPYYLMKHRSPLTIRAAEANKPKKGVNLTRILVGLLGVMLHVCFIIAAIYKGSNRMTPYSSITSLNIMLVVFVLDTNVLAFIQIKILKRLPFLNRFFSKVSPVPYSVKV